MEQDVAAAGEALQARVGPGVGFARLGAPAQGGGLPGRRRVVPAADPQPELALRREDPGRGGAHGPVPAEDPDQGRPAVHRPSSASSARATAAACGGWTQEKWSPGTSTTRRPAPHTCCQ